MAAYRSSYYGSSLAVYGDAVKRSDNHAQRLQRLFGVPLTFFAALVFSALVVLAHSSVRAIYWFVVIRAIEA